MRFSGVLISLAAFALAAVLPTDSRAISPQPVVEYAEGYKTWMAPKEAKRWRLETLLYELRQDNDKLKDKTLKQLGIARVRVGRNLLRPKIDEPVQVVVGARGRSGRDDHTGR